MSRRFPSSRALAAAALLLLPACDDASTEPMTAAFLVEAGGEQFRVRASDPAAVAALEARMQSDTRGVITGRLVRGNGGFNAPWSWHLEPATVEAPDIAIELCDGRPSMVEADLGYWVDNVKTFCPWGARVVRRTD